MRPPPKLTISEWADRERRLSSDTSAEPGRWRTSRFEPLRGIMDSVTENERTVVMKAAQLGLTEVGLNTVGYFMEQDPSSILYVMPNVQPMGRDFSVDRLAPMIRDTPCLRGKLSTDTRDTTNTLLNKTFIGGNISITGANAPSGLRSKPKRVVFFDEVDGYPVSAGNEGDPVNLGIKRTANFWNRRIAMISTPTVKGLSRIEIEFEKSDKRYFNIRCPHCDELHVLRWQNVTWKDGDPKTAKFQCPHCEGYYNNAQKNAAVRKGHWIATAPFKGIAGFHISELYSSWRSISEIVTDFLAAKDNPEQLQVFINTVLGELWVDGGVPLDAHALLNRCEPYENEVPDRCLILTAGVDTHPDRLQVEVVGWAGGEESWSLSYHTIYGDPEIPEGQPKSPWTSLTDYLRRTWQHPIYGDMIVEWACIDTGGQNTQAVYDYVRRHKGDRFFGIKGRGGEGVPIIGKPTRGRTGKKARALIDLYTVGTDQAKNIIYRRLRIEDPGPGYCHFPQGRSLEYFEELTVEKIVTTYVKGYPVRSFVCPKGKRNEALDLRVYAFAALTLAGVQWDRLAYRMKQRSRKITAGPAKPRTKAVEEKKELMQESAEQDKEADLSAEETDEEVIIIHGDDDPPNVAEDKGAAIGHALRRKHRRKGRLKISLKSKW